MNYQLHRNRTGSKRSAGRRMPSILANIIRYSNVKDRDIIFKSGALKGQVWLLQVSSKVFSRLYFEPSRESADCARRVG